ncbi:MAG: hypothetical protein EBX40_00475 [Gammaproteobacteria bacterium]|nr:hypothetical protein [Gammaproteobacteria bacterium]
MAEELIIDDAVSDRFFEALRYLIYKGRVKNKSDFADKIKEHRANMARIEQHERKLSLENIVNLKRHYPEISLDWLLLGEGELEIHDSSVLARLEALENTVSKIVDTFKLATKDITL